MTPDEWSKVKAFFDEASELAAGEPRDRFVASIEPESARSEVRRLLSLHDAESAIFDRLQPDTNLIRSAADLRSFNSGDVIAGRFRIVRFIAEGGMGEVYEAQDEQLNERVAVKTLRWETAQDASALARFRQEIQLARRVTSPNVCRIHDLWEHKSAGGRSTWFLTMEFLEGETLARRIERGAMPVAEALPLVQQMCAGLGAAHDAGIMHRDFKSSNVILVPRAGGGPERAVVTDFGLSRSFDVRTTATGAVMGTPAYMAPEQIEGGELGPATDLYALGVVMYEMLTGMLPFRSSSPMALAVKKLRETPVPPSSVVAGVPAVWDQVVMRCMQYRMNDRFQTAASVMEAIETGRMPSLRASKDLEFRVPARWWQVALVMVLVAAGVFFRVRSKATVFDAKPEAVRWYGEGVQALHDGSPSRAQHLFEKALSVDPEFAAGRARLAQSLTEQEMVDAARDELLKIGAEKAVALSGAERVLVEGVRAMALRDYPGAVRQFVEHLRHPVTGDVSEAYLDLAKAQLLANEAAEAAVSCAAAMDKRSEFAGAALLCARIACRRGDRKQCLALSQKAAEIFTLRGQLDGRLAAVLVQVVELLDDSNLADTERTARQALATAATLENKYFEIRVRRALSAVLRMRGNFDEATAEAEAAIRLAKADGQLVLEIDARNDLARAKFAQFKFEEAEQLFRQSEDLATSNRLQYQAAFVRMELAEVLIRESKTAEGRQKLAKASEYFERNGMSRESDNLRKLRINALINTGQFDIARGLSEELLADAARRSSPALKELALKRLGHIAIVEGDLLAAVDFSRRAQETAEAQGQTILNDRMNELRLHLEMGDTEAARRVVASIVKAAAANPQAGGPLEWKIRQAEARLAAVEGRFSEAVRVARLALSTARNQSDKAELQVLLGRVLALTKDIAGAESSLQQASEHYRKVPDLDLQVKCDCARAEVLLAAGMRSKAVEVAGAALEAGEKKAQRLALWQCSLVRAAADPRGKAGYREQFGRLTAKWPEAAKLRLVARKDLLHLLRAVGI